MKLNNNNINKYKLNKDKKINIFNIEKEYKEIKEKSKELDINIFIDNINFYLEDEKEIEIIKEYFKNYKYYKYSIIHILIDNEEKEIIILRNNNEKKFFENSHIKYLLNDIMNNKKIIDIENELNEIIINKNFIIYDYIKYDYIDNK